MNKTLHIRITGRVQGVGFRNFLYNLAVKKNAKGKVKNELDGSVSLLITMSECDVDEFINNIRIGNGFSEVSCIKVIERNEENINEDSKGFLIMY